MNKYLDIVQTRGTVSTNIVLPLRMGEVVSFQGSVLLPLREKRGALDFSYIITIMTKVLFKCIFIDRLFME